MKGRIIGYLAAGAVFCGARWADLALWTDRETGLVTAGAVWQRYLLLAVFVIAALVVGRTAAGQAASMTVRPINGRAAAMQACGPFTGRKWGTTSTAAASSSS